MSESGNSLAAAEAVAKEKGLAVILPNDDELFLDIDDDESLSLFRACVEMMNQKVQLTYEQRPSPSGRAGRYHIVVKMPRAVTTIERIAIQSFMGSDRKRECLSWCRMQDGETTVTRFFEKPV